MKNYVLHFIRHGRTEHQRHSWNICTGLLTIS